MTAVSPFSYLNFYNNSHDNNSIQFLFFNLTGQQPSGPLEKQQNEETQTKKSKGDTYETNANRKTHFLKQFISTLDDDDYDDDDFPKMYQSARMC